LRARTQRMMPGEALEIDCREISVDADCYERNLVVQMYLSRQEVKEIASRLAPAAGLMLNDSDLPAYFEKLIPHLKNYLGQRYDTVLLERAQEFILERIACPMEGPSWRADI